MEPRTARRRGVIGGVRRRAEPPLAPAAPLVRPAPRAAMFFPLVVLAAVLPGLYALRCWDLNPPGPWWGLRGLVVLEGRWLDQVPAGASMGPPAEARSFRAVALQPPLYAWLEAIGLALSAHRAPLATILPSYAAGAAVVVLVYLLGRTWRGPGCALTAAVLAGFNRELLVQMQQASPTTLGLAGALVALLAYGRHAAAGQRPRWPWILLGGLGLGLSLMAVGGLALAVVPVVGLHRLYLGSEPAPGGRPRRWWRAWRDDSVLGAGALALALGVGLAAPWHAAMAARYGPAFAAALLAPGDHTPACRPCLPVLLVALTPVTLPLGLLGAGRAIRRALTGDPDDGPTVGGALAVLWLAVAALLPALWPGGPRPALGLFLLIPLSLLAAEAMTDLANRRIPVRALVWLAPATAATVAWWESSGLRDAVASLAAGRRLDPAMALGLHLGLDLLVGAALVVRGLDRWAHHRDDRRRAVLGGFLLAVLALTVGAGIREVRFRHRETADLLALRRIILRRQQAHPFDLVAVVGPDRPPGPADEAARPGGRLRFILRSTLPHLAQLDLPRADDLLNLPDGRRLVILAGTGPRLPYAVQAQLGLEAIHPGRSGILDAFATVHDTQHGDEARRPARAGHDDRRRR
ncbi:MAG TPA: glycosyltransferase family 39 protein [Isosphaeraceae bacterium]